MLARELEPNGKLFLNHLSFILYGVIMGPDFEVSSVGPTLGDAWHPYPNQQANLLRRFAVAKPLLNGKLSLILLATLGVVKWLGASCQVARSKLSSGISPSHHYGSLSLHSDGG